MSAEFVNDGTVYQQYEEFDAIHDDAETEATGGWREYITGRIGRFATVVGLTVAANLAPTGSAQAAEPTCHGDYCSGQYADTTNCGEDARTLAETQLNESSSGLEISVGPIAVGDTDSKEVGKLQVRWSDRCGTAWGRFLAKTESHIDYIGIEHDGGYSQERKISGRVEGTPAVNAFTPMVYARGREVRAYAETWRPTGLPSSDGTYWVKP